MEDIALKLKAYRLRRLWTLEQLGAVIGLSHQTVWNIENGKVTPTELTVAKIKKALPDF